MLLSCDTQYAPNLILQHGYAYDYDSNGNEYTTGTNNELTSDGAYTYTYDDEGNRISKQNSTNRELYEWDYRNRLTSVTKQTYNAETGAWENVQIVEYTYDYNNVWIRKVLDSNGDGTADSKTIFIPENYQTTVQLDDTNLTDANGPTITHHYLWTPNTQDKLLADVTANNVLWSLTDHLGSIRDIVQQTSSGLVVPAHIIYDAYGNIISCTDSTGQPISNPILFAYTGKAFDVSTQLQNNINRWYDATIGRWLTPDPIGFEGNDTNLYRYVRNQTITYWDRAGLYPCYIYIFAGNRSQSEHFYEKIKPLFDNQPSLVEKDTYNLWLGIITGYTDEQMGTYFPLSNFPNMPSNDPIENVYDPDLDWTWGPGLSFYTMNRLLKEVHKKAIKFAKTQIGECFCDFVTIQFECSPGLNNWLEGENKKLASPCGKTITVTKDDKE